MDPQFREIHDLVARVRARWRRLTLLQASVRASLAASGVLALALSLSHWTTRAPIALAVLGAAALVLVAGALIWGLWPAREVPSDARVARFVEERDPSLDDRLVSAIDLAASERQDGAPGLAAPMMADAARRAAAIDPALVVPAKALGRAWRHAMAAALLLAAIVVSGRHTARQSVDALTLTLFPSRVTLDVTPGSTRLESGSLLTIEARLLGNRAPVVAQVLRADERRAAATDGAGELEWRPTDMVTDTSGTFRLAMGTVTSSFKYRVVAGTASSPVYDVAVARAPRVTRIDVEYLYPLALGLEPRVEEDGGDIYAPAGTDVRVRIHTDRETATGKMSLADGKSIELTAQGASLLTGLLKVVEDGSYRIALADNDGLKNPGDTEYFIRTLEDRPPEVRVLRPARDRSVMPLEEVDIEAQAEDDFGIDRLELVYAVRGGAEKVVPFGIPRRSTSVTGAHTLFLEDLRVQPGDFVSYYVRARDLARGKRASEVRSDIFFLEVQPFDQEFTLAQSQAMGGGGGNRSIDDLVAVQKEIIVATWKLDRRAQAAKGAKSEQDIRSVARAEAELKVRVEQTASAFRESTMRDPRRMPQPGRGGPQPPRPGGQPPDTLRAGQTLPEEDAMTSAAMAMGRAVESLNALKTAQAVPSEMDALNHLLKAQADVKKRQVTQQRAGGAAGSNRATQDLSSLFDKELQRQQTNYETPTSTEQREDQGSTLDKIKELAQRQDELIKRQQELARDRQLMTAEELKRELEKLGREQTELRQRAEELAQQMGSRQSQNGQGSTGADASRKMKAVSEEMRNAASELRRADPGQASTRGSRALEQLRDLERQLQAGAPDERRRALGEMQLEARQLADSERQVASELAKVGPGEAGQDGLRRLAAEQERLADRARRLQQGLKQHAAAAGGSKDRESSNNMRQAATEAARELERQRIPDRMRESADQLRAASGQPDAGSNRSQAKSAAAPLQETARALDKLADKLSAADDPKDGESRRLSEQLARAQELRERIDSLTRELERLGQQTNEGAGANGPKPSESGRGGGQGSAGNGADASRLRDEYNRQLQETRKLLDELGREDGTFARGGMGFTFEGQGMTLSAPGTEAFKQDFAKWEQLRKQATQALDRAQSSLSQKLQAMQARDRLAAGVEDEAPAEYRQHVDNYFKALATKKKP